MSSHPRALLVLYATETGNAEDAAYRIARQCTRIDLQARVASVDAYPLEELVYEPLVVFVVSTTGSGKEPRSMTPLWSMLLRADLPHDLFEDMQFSIFGLGDTAYEQFCWPARRLERRLLNLGGVKLCERGEGDDQHRLGIDGAFRPWIEDLLGSLIKHYPLEDGRTMRSADELPTARVFLRKCTSTTPDNAEVDPGSTLDTGATYREATVKLNRRITAEGWHQDVRHLEFVFDEEIEFHPGDIAVIDPLTSPQDVEELLIATGWTTVADEPLAITSATGDPLPHTIPTRATLRMLFTRHLSITSVPRRSFFEALAHFAHDDLEREKLAEFLADDGADELYEYCFRPRRTILEVLQEFRVAARSIPQEYVFDVFPASRPRHFSIASAAHKHPREVHLCVAIVRYRTKVKVRRRGVCTSYLASLQIGDTLRVGLRPGLMSLPPSATPVICIGPGTGVAPMRAILEERIWQGAQNNTLFFGCRHAAKDQHYHAEWTAYDRDGVLRYKPAFSRDGPEGVKRVYVQDVMSQDEERNWIRQNIKERGAWIYVSGSSNKMPAAVKAAVVDIVREGQGDAAEDEAKAYVANMERDGRYTEECWS